ncbi:OLC1v1014857C1 [Oldenlandia corymbosa var. corymbosa]|uniref:OLC1v1014857C1 n=1 Tax=Oldenlandia corymbosa var. corymbosa TaxID=529605 RepID=A0AAV1E442_OLDCO|nr:OLC1v1014857C1 [Oldenlandia corymbosa var. corymbosa]
MANYCCSIELEPRTLREGQLNQAREVAVGIIQKKEEKEATSMFAQGLKPVSSIKEMVMMVQEIETLNIVEDVVVRKLVGDNGGNNNTTQTPCQCSCSSPVVNDSSPEIQDQSQLIIKEPVSAPF